jgi:transcriptional regulator with XRE-family HTH domain
MIRNEQVLGEFIDAWNAGERPDPETYLRRVPSTQRDELADEIQMWLLIAPTPDYDDATRDAIAADPVLLAALAAGEETAKPWAVRLRAFRERAGLAREQVAEALSAALQLPGDTDRTLAYLAQAEQDELDERRISRRLVRALASVLDTDVDALRPAWGSPGIAVQRYRLADDNLDEETLRAQFDALSRAASSPAPAPLDDVDRLFLGGPDA